MHSITPGNFQLKRTASIQALWNELSIIWDYGLKRLNHAEILDWASVNRIRLQLTSTLPEKEMIINLPTLLFIFPLSTSAENVVFYQISSKHILNFKSQLTLDFSVGCLHSKTKWCYQKNIFFFWVLIHYTLKCQVVVLIGII